MEYHFTRSRARSELEGSDVEPGDVAPGAATSSSSTNVAAVGGPESVSTESAGPVSAPTHPLPAGSPPPRADSVYLRPAGPPQVGSLPWGTPAV